jgi:hypothetical protein
MESVINKIKRLPLSVEEAYNADLESLVSYLLIDFDIQFRGSKENASKEVLTKYIKKCLGMQDKTCNALTRMGTKCMNKANYNSKYCKRHVEKELFDTMERADAVKSDKKMAIEIVGGRDQIKSKENMSKKFIEDTFYYIDEKYIYNMDTMEKEGYIDSEKGVRYILTKDPFVLMSS